MGLEVDHRCINKCGFNTITSLLSDEIGGFELLCGKKLNGVNGKYIQGNKLKVSMK